MKWLLVVLLLISSTACINTKYIPQESLKPAVAYLPLVDESTASQYAPIFLVEENDILYNRIGTPSVIRRESGGLRVHVDPERPTIYAQKFSFKTEKASYANYIYRIHFQKVPFSFFPFYLTGGKNVGLIIIVTIDEEDNPVLLTTVHTCGCYLAFVPTSFLPESAFPKDWKFEKQRVYGENLPGILYMDDNLYENLKSKIVIVLKNATHRIKWISIQHVENIKKDYNFFNSPIVPMKQLQILGQADEPISFFETSGPKKGYVKGSHKPFEKLLMSWWAMDLYVGEDKDFEPNKDTGAIFYTSLKFWDRTDSDMRNFKNFLSYWGWKL